MRAHTPTSPPWPSRLNMLLPFSPIAPPPTPPPPSCGAPRTPLPPPPLGHCPSAMAEGRPLTHRWPPSDPPPKRMPPPDPNLARLPAPPTPLHRLGRCPRSVPPPLGHCQRPHPHPLVRDPRPVPQSVSLPRPCLSAIAVSHTHARPFRRCATPGAATRAPSTTPPLGRCLRRAVALALSPPLGRCPSPVGVATRPIPAG